MPHMRRVVIVAVVAVAVVGGGIVAALSSGDDEGGCGSGYPETPRCMAEAFVLRDDASKCDLVEPSVLGEVMGVSGPNARERCAKLVTASPAPKKIQILKVEQESGGEDGEEAAGEEAAGEEAEREREEAEREREGGEAEGEEEAEVEFLADGKEGEIVLRREDGGRWRIVALGKG